MYYREIAVVAVNSKSVCFESCRADADGEKEGEDLTRPFAGLAANE